MENNNEQKEHKHENNNPAGKTPEHSASELKNDKKLMSILAYIGILVLVPYFTSKEDPTVKFHIKQGLVLLSASVLIWALGYVLPIWIILRLLNLGVIVLSIIGIVNVINNKKEELPVVGKFAKYFKF